MLFRQQIFLTYSANAGATGTGIVFGFGNAPKTKFSLQASFYSGQTGNPPTGGTPTAPTTAEISIVPSNDAVNFDSNKLLDWNTAGSNPNNNGDVVNIAGEGPFSYIQLNWNITWGNATSCTITINGETESVN